ncbi:TetR/AcrR family transcriptional regulator [Amycolatopsis sp. NPDC049252]|uniref:TetR/AcrR family transcriptional regulator n=1 Tax=Amycolatopsis sp. NPDC049252 TaxID=3363933 RepID=UPI00371643B3
MAAAPIDRILDAAYACFVRHGMRRTTMDDIAAAAGMSRPAVYQYVKNKDDVFLRLASRLFEQALTAARTAASADGPLADRLYNVLAAKLSLTLRVVQDSPHAAELLDESARLSGTLVEGFKTSILTLLTDTVTSAADTGEIAVDGPDPVEIAELALALNHGIEESPVDPDRLRARLRLGITLMVGGLKPGKPLSGR